MQVLHLQSSSFALAITQVKHILCHRSSSSVRRLYINYNCWIRVASFATSKQFQSNSQLIMPKPRTNGSWRYMLCEYYLLKEACRRFERTWTQCIPPKRGRSRLPLPC